MDPVISALLRSWEWRADVLVPLVLTLTFYGLGWKRIRSVSSGCSGGRLQSLGSGWRLTTYLVGCFLVALALLSPLEVLSGQLFFMHMIQHLFLVMCAPPLLLMANPFPVLLWGMPSGIRRWVGSGFCRHASFRRALVLLTRPGLVWLYFVVLYVGWHDPAAYDAALRSDIIHDIEHLSFFVASLLYWWHVTAAGPRVHAGFHYGWRIAYLLVTVPVNMLIGIVITFARQPIYHYYTEVPRPWNLSVMEDQMLGGVIMWIPGSMMLLIAVLVIVARILGGQGRRPAKMSVAGIGS